MSLLLEAFPAEDRPSLCRLEGNGGLLAALRTGSTGFRFVGYLSGRGCTQYGNSLRLTYLAAFRFVLKLLIVEKQLFACGKNKVATAVDTLQHLVLEFHPSPHSPPASRSLKKARGFPYARVRSESLRTPPQTFTLDSAHLRVTQVTAQKETLVMDLGGSPALPNARRGEKEWVAAPTAATHRLSVLLLASFFATTFSCQRFLDTFFFAGLQVKGVALNLLDNVVLLHLALETSQRIFKGFALLNSDFRQTHYTPKLVPLDSIVIATFRRQVKGECQSFATRLHPPLVDIRLQSFIWIRESGVCVRRSIATQAEPDAERTREWLPTGWQAYNSRQESD